MVMFRECAACILVELLRGGNCASNVCIPGSLNFDSVSLHQYSGSVVYGDFLGLGGDNK